MYWRTKSYNWTNPVDFDRSVNLKKKSNVADEFGEPDQLICRDEIVLEARLVIVGVVPTSVLLVSKTSIFSALSAVTALDVINVTVRGLLACQATKSFGIVYRTKITLSVKEAVLPTQR